MVVGLGVVAPIEGFANASTKESTLEQIRFGAGSLDKENVALRLCMFEAVKEATSTTQSQGCEFQQVWV